MEPRVRRGALLAAAALLVLVDLAIRSLDPFSPLVPDTIPSTLFASVNSQVTDVVRALRSDPPGRRPVVLMGNSQMDLGSRPLPLLRESLVAAGAPPDTTLVPLFVYASAITDAEAIARSIDRLEPAVVILGVSAPDVGTSAEAARLTPASRILDVGLADGPLPPADLEARLDRWARTVWQAYRYRALLADLLFPPGGRRLPRSFFDEPHTKEEFYRTTRGAEVGGALAALRPGFESGDTEAARRYVEILQGPGYLDGLRRRWRDLSPQPEQLVALGAFADHVHRAGARPVVVLLPENPLLEHDPEIGGVVRQRSDAAAAAVATVAAEHDAVVVDLRRGAGVDAFLDMNHLFYQHGGLAPRLASELAQRGVLGESS